MKEIQSEYRNIRESEQLDVKFALNIIEDKTKFKFD
jgi:hypothetical protein